ncbi:MULTISPECIES: response regulator transcription factor [Dehalococcoides]|uniref:response regulator transcription factor n=1 Tax=Dehalococcoides TaxID=61434 RepID=UPI000558E7CA|nr:MULTISPECIES: response regulator transcription factor [Dehalococcoides]QYY58576.1 response regulator transcription factor [Dehalococcoides mccartyi]BAQ34041.1 putative two-component response regulator [Dehalococcoides sp. UCH007]
MKVLLVEDDSGIIEYICFAFGIGWPNCQIITTSTGEQAIDLAEQETPDIVILDIGLPDISGFDVIKEIRKFSDVPILITSVRDSEQDIVKGIQLGADEYVVKPFGQLELIARVKALIRRNSHNLRSPIVKGALSFNPISGELFNKSRRIILTKTESIIIGILLKNSPELATFSELSEAIWGEEYDGAIEALRVYINRLRSKIETDHQNPVVIVTKLGKGYCLENVSSKI